MGSVKGRAGTQGPAPLVLQRREFARLIARGVSNAEACRVVGVNRRTGTRWLYGRTVTSSSGTELHYPAMATTTITCLSARFLSEDERVLIADWVREVLGNVDEAGRYRRFTAHRMALGRLARPKQRRLAGDLVLRDKVQSMLKKRWSPEQIAQRDYLDEVASLHGVTTSDYLRALLDAVLAAEAKAALGVPGADDEAALTRAQEVIHEVVDGRQQR